MGEGAIPQPSMSRSFRDLVLRGRSRRVGQTFLHQNQIEPAAEFAADLRHSRDLVKAQRRVQPDRCGVGAFDAGHHHVLAQEARPGDQGRQQGTADALAMDRRIDIDGVLHGVPVAVERPEITEAGKTDNRPGGLGDQHGIAPPPPVRQPSLALRQIGGGVVPYRRGVQRRVIIDGQDAGGVRVYRIANCVIH